MSDVAQIDPPQSKVRISPKVFNCEQCGGQIQISFPGHAVVAVCKHCSSTYDVSNENFLLIKKAREKAKEIAIPIGTRGKLRDVLWEVVGYQQKCDADGYYFWDEYLLFNPYFGYRFLSQSRGHWSMFEVLRINASFYAGAPDVASFDGLDYRKYTAGTSVVEYVQGEFFWQVKKGDQAKTLDYIDPPYMLSVEQSEGEIVASHGEYLTKQDMLDAFGETSKFFRSSGVAPNQPSPFAKKVMPAWLVAVVAFCAVLFIYVVQGSIKQESLVFSHNYVVTPLNKGNLFVSDEFLIPGGLGNIVIDSFSDVSNDWVELRVTLVNEKSDQAFELSQAIEYYFGSGWTEGSRRTVNYLSSVPGGTYRLLVEADAGAFARGQSTAFWVKISRNVPAGSNLFLVILALLMYPSYLASRSFAFEKSRWQDSEFAPGVYSSGGDQ